MKKICGIYRITNSITNKSYIGQSMDIKSRWWHHKHDLNNNKHTNSYLQNAWNKYRENNFKFEVIEECNKNNINEREIYWISFFDTFKNGYNKSLGGESGSRGKIYSEEEKLRISKRIKGIQNPFYGKQHSYETKEKLRDINKGKKYSYETNRKKGIHNAKKVKCDNQYFNTVKECAEFYNIKPYNISDWLHGKSYMPKKFYELGLSYVNEDNSKIRIKPDKLIWNNKRQRSIKRELIFFDGVIYRSITDCARFLKISNVTIGDWLNGKSGMPIEFYEKGLRYLNKDNSQIFVNKSNKQVICITTNKLFNSIKEASKLYDIFPNMISACCKGKRKSTGKHPITGEKLKWMYYEDYITQQNNQEAVNT